MGRIPDRWKAYSGCGEPIKDIPIVAFKTPLAKKYSVQHDPNQEFVEQVEEFTPETLVNSITELGYEVVVVIDLTNTFRYYNGTEEFGKKHDIQYEKVKCEGQKIPDDSVMKRVAEIINDVIHVHGKDSKKIVGIHCTHGVNRTGYLVARYMIEWLGYEPQNAIDAFDTARGHKMEREAYLNDLKGRKPALKFEEWKKELSLVDSVNGTTHPMNLWTDFGSDGKELPDYFEDNMYRNSQYHPYYHSNRGHSNQYWRGHRQRRRPYYRSNGHLHEPYA